ncbi:hypothetical protein G5V59_21340 [Nocardioides sp. W3-2-3]|uniref:hypothetical protein n=1 Tax=Nocardioides convexus TaxID=2712224 RepID=UPI002418B862|nr:hypothetical protein [Nocardioides convexus]NHA01487.1 hypothetical protein [Nocardioides convexus]
MTTRPVGEIWFSPTGLVDAKIDEEGTIWTLDPEGLVTALTWSPESRSFIVEDTRKVDHSGPGSVLVAHEKGVTLFGPDNGIVVQVGTGRDIVHGGIDIKGRLAGPGVSPDDLVPVASPDNGTVVIVSGDRVVQVPLGASLRGPGRAAGLPRLGLRALRGRRAGSAPQPGRQGRRRDPYAARGHRHRAGARRRLPPDQRPGRRHRHPGAAQRRHQDLHPARARHPGPQRARRRRLPRPAAERRPGP